jgi:hypothetical protein
MALQQGQSRGTPRRNAAPVRSCACRSAGVDRCNVTARGNSTVPSFGHIGAGAEPCGADARRDAINSVQESLRGVQPPAKQGPSFQLLMSAASLAKEAVSAIFTATALRKRSSRSPSLPRRKPSFSN